MSVLPFDVNTFIEKHKATLSAEELSGVQELSQGYLRGADYQRNSNQLKTKYEQAFNANEAYAEQLRQYEADAQEAINKVRAVESRYGSIDRFIETTDPNTLRTPSGDIVSKSEVAALVSDFNSKLGQMKTEFHQFAEGTYEMVVKMPSFTRQYEERYKAPFDGKAFMDFLDENKISNPDIGYRLFTAEKEATYSKENHDRELQEAREQGARDFATRNHIPETAGRPAFKTPLMMPVRPQHALPTAPATTPVTPPAPAAPSPAVRTAADAVNHEALPLAQRMQQNFLARKDQP